MWYQTTFHIKAIDLKPALDRPILNKSFFNSLELYGVDVESRKDGRFAIGDGESYKWREHEEDLCEVSSQYTDVVFILDGEGEQTGDVWRKFFLNGKLVHSWSPTIEPPEWDDLDISTNR